MDAPNESWKEDKKRNLYYYYPLSTYYTQVSTTLKYSRWKLRKSWTNGCSTFWQKYILIRIYIGAKNLFYGSSITHKTKWLTMAEPLKFKYFLKFSMNIFYSNWSPMDDMRSGFYILWSKWILKIVLVKKCFLKCNTVKPRFWNTSWSAANVFYNVPPILYCFYVTIFLDFQKNFAK